jgi:hypothetical protein
MRPAKKPTKFSNAHQRRNTTMTQYGNHIFHRSEIDNRSEEEKAFDKLSPAAVKQVIKRAMASEEEKAAADQFVSETVPLFFKINSACIDNAHNTALLKNQWETTYGVEVPTYDQLEECYFTLRTAGVLNLNRAAVARENAQAIAEKADSLIAQRKAAEFNEEEANSISMEDLRKRAGSVGGSW